MGFWNLNVFSQLQTSPNRAIAPNPSQTVPPDEEKYSDIWADGAILIQTTSAVLYEASFSSKFIIYCLAVSLTGLGCW